MSDTFSRLPASAVETVVLTFELANYSSGTNLQAIQKAISDPQVQKAITETLQNQAKTRLQTLKQSAPTVSPKAGAPAGSGSGSKSSSSSPSSSSSSSTPMASPLGNTSASSVQDALKQLQLNPNYSLLVQDLKKLESQFAKSVVGVWVDENKKTLIIIASGIAVAAATAMYFTKTGDTPADWATQLAKGQYPLSSLARSSLALAIPSFSHQPAPWAARSPWM